MKRLLPPRALWFVSLMLLLSGIARAETYELPYDFSLFAEYDQILQKLKPGDQLRFPPHPETYVLGKYLSRGETGLVFRLENRPGAVIKIPLDFTRRAFIEPTARGYFNLRARGVPVVELLEVIPDSAMVMSEVIDIRKYGESNLTLDAFLRNYGTLEPQLKSRLRRELLDLASQTAYFTEMTDFVGIQAVSTISRGWALLDFFAPQRFFEFRGLDKGTGLKGTPFHFIEEKLISEYANSPHRLEFLSLLNDIRETIRARRNSVYERFRRESSLIRTGSEPKIETFEEFKQRLIDAGVCR